MTVDRGAGPAPNASRVAIVHDYFTQQGGAERFVGELARLFPDAPIHAAVADREAVPPGIDPARLRTTRLQSLRERGVPLSLLAPLLPTAFGTMRLGRARIVISSTSAFAHHVRAPAGAVHVAYCHSPPHFLWEADDYYAARGATGRLIRPVVELLRRPDVAAARRVDAYVANSGFTADRIRRIYGREAAVIPPPIDAQAFAPSAQRSGRFLVVARLRRHKRIELAIEAAARAGRPLDVIGDGPDLAFLRRQAGPNVRFLGRLDDDAVAASMARTSGLIVPAIEDFGLTMAEVQAAGRPPIALAGGGASEIVRDGITGFLFPEPTVEAIVAAMRRAESSSLDPDALVASARRFDRAEFDRAFCSFIAGVAARHEPRDGDRNVAPA